MQYNEQIHRWEATVDLSGNLYFIDTFTSATEAALKHDNAVRKINEKQCKQGVGSNNVMRMGEFNFAVTKEMLKWQKSKDENPATAQVTKKTVQHFGLDEVDITCPYNTRAADKLMATTPVSGLIAAIDKIPANTHPTFTMHEFVLQMCKHKAYKEYQDLIEIEEVQKAIRVEAEAFPGIIAHNVPLTRNAEKITASVAAITAVQGPVIVRDVRPMLTKRKRAPRRVCGSFAADKNQ